jgi:hypothetical protein
MQLEEALAVLNDTADQINDQSMAFEDQPVIEKQLEKDYRAIVAVQNVMKNNLRAIKNPHLMANSIFLYDIDDEDVSLIDFVGAIHVVMHDHVAEVKWIGSYGAHGGGLLRAAMMIAKHVQNAGFAHVRAPDEGNLSAFVRGQILELLDAFQKCRAAKIFQIRVRCFHFSNYTGCLRRRSR